MPNVGQTRSARDVRSRSVELQGVSGRGGTGLSGRVENGNEKWDDFWCSRGLLPAQGKGWL